MVIPCSLGMTMVLTLQRISFCGVNKWTLESGINLGILPGSGSTLLNGPVLRYCRESSGSPVELAARSY